MTAAPVLNFSFATAFSRTVGWVTPAELETLRRKKVAVAGMGGVGGSHLLTLTRLGIGTFHIADFDRFEVHNFNRQAGAFMSTLGEAKVDVLARMAQDIHPDLKLKKFSAGVQPENLEDFFNGVDLYVDGLDYFAFQAREMVYDYCQRKGIPIVTAGPIAMGAAMLVFMPGRMGANAYFDWRREDDEVTKAAKFLIGLTPSLPHLRQLVEKSSIDFKAHKGPSTPMACELCAGVAGVEAMKILLKRGRVRAAPYSIHFDAFENRLHIKNVWWGNRHPLQRLKIAMALRGFRKAP